MVSVTGQLLVLGGSQGARPINNAMIEIAEHLRGDPPERLHRPPDRSRRCRAGLEHINHQDSMHEYPFIDDMGDAYRTADVRREH